MIVGHNDDDITILAFLSRIPDKLNYSFSVSKLEMLFVKKL